MSRQSATRKPDILTTNHGTIITLTPLSSRGKAWIRRHVDADAWQYNGDAIYSDPTCAIDIMRGALAACLTLQDANTGRIAHIDTAFSVVTH